MKFPRTFSTFFFLLFAITATSVLAGGKLEIHDAWVREAPPNVSVMAAYLTLRNHSTKPYTLISASSPDFERVEMHRTEQQDGMAKMLPVSRVLLDINGSVSFQPGGMHLMLMQPKKSFKAGDTISLTLFFSDESSREISISVKKGSGIDEHEMHHGSHESGHDEHPQKSSNDQHNSHNH